jgi:hypothetical protein
MTLFEAPSQFREKAAICRIFELPTFAGSLAEGLVYRWFALNIPMDLGTGGSFNSDIDIIACLLLPPKSVPQRSSYRPHSDGFVYKTWEVKVSLLCKDGTARSLKLGKTARTIAQLQAYKGFGAADASLLDVYICEAGFMDSNSFPPNPVKEAVNKRMPALKSEGFGYEMLPFEHAKYGDIDFGLKAFSIPTWYGSPSRKIRLLAAPRTAPNDGFARLIGCLNDCYRREIERFGNNRRVCVVYCRACRQMSLVRMKQAWLCGVCNKDLRLQ